MTSRFFRAAVLALAVGVAPAAAWAQETNEMDILLQQQLLLKKKQQGREQSPEITPLPQGETPEPQREIVEQPPEILPAPAATCPGAKTIRQLSRPLRLLHAQVIDHLALGDVETQAQFVVEFHWSLLNPQEALAPRPSPTAGRSGRHARMPPGPTVR